MRTSAPNKTVWLIAVVIGGLGLLAGLGILPIPYSFWLVTAAFLLLAIATAVRGL